MNEKVGVNPLNEKSKFGRLTDPKFQILSALLWIYLIGTVIFSFLVMIWEINLEKMPYNFLANPSLAIVIIFENIVVVGLLPIIYTILNKEDVSWYGICKPGLEKSLKLGFLIVMGYFSISLLLTGQLLGNFYPIEFNTNCALSRVRCIHPSFSNIAFSTIGALFYGPIEVYFVIWLILKFDQIFQSEDVLISKGVIVGVLVFGLRYFLTSFLEGLIATILFFAFAMIYKLTNNSLGPMIAWMLTQEYNWFLISILLTIP